VALVNEKGTVYIVDDDASFLAAMARLLRASGFDVKTFPSAREFLGDLKPDAQGCVIADLKMPGVSGLELQDALIHADSPMPVIFLTGHGDIPASVRAIRHGAEDFLTKRVSKEELLDAVRRALARNARARDERARLRQLRIRFDALTHREREVLAHVLQGKLNKQTAFDLGITERTVKVHRSNAMKKLRVESVAELTRLVQEAGFFKNGQLAL
jgi:FixJ family two-component response regulator